MSEFDKVAELLKDIVDDRTVPRNIRTKCEDSIETLKSDKEAEAVRISTVISTLDEISNDPNIPMYTRTQIWNIVSALESLKK